MNNFIYNLIQYQVDPNIQNPYAKFDLRELVKYLESSQQNDLKYSKRGEKRDSLAGTDLEPTIESDSDGDLGFKNIDLLWQAVEDEISQYTTTNLKYLFELVFDFFIFFVEKPLQMRFLSPRLGRNAYPHGLNLPPLPPRIGKRNTIFAPRMGK